MKKINPRLKANRKLLAILSDYFEANPDIRFSQALMNCYYVMQLPENTKHPFPTMLWRDEFFLESEELLKRVKEVME